MSFNSVQHDNQIFKTFGMTIEKTHGKVFVVNLHTHNFQNVHK